MCVCVNKGEEGSKNNYGKKWLICHRRAEVLFFPLSSFALFLSFLFKVTIITNKRLDFSPALGMIMEKLVGIEDTDTHMHQRKVTRGLHNACAHTRTVNVCVFSCTCSNTAALSWWHSESIHLEFETHAQVFFENNSAGGRTGVN